MAAGQPPASSLPCSSPSRGRSRNEIIAEIDFVGGFLSISGMILFLAGLPWGAYQLFQDLPAVKAGFAYIPMALCGKCGRRLAQPRSAIEIEGESALECGVCFIRAVSHTERSWQQGNSGSRLNNTRTNKRNLLQPRVVDGREMLFWPGDRRCLLFSSSVCIGRT